MIKMNALPTNMHVRVPTMDDLQAVFELINACDIVDEGMPDHTLDDLRIYWQSPDFNLASDAWLVETSEGKPVGYADTDHEGHGKVFSLLQHFMSEFYRRGIRKVGLGVDSQNLTGATRLYERAGMHVALQHDTYEKELRAGKDLRTQSISV